MNRREAIAALTSLPGVARIYSADVKPTDVVVVECDKALDAVTVDRIRETLRQIWPERQVVVFTKGIRMKLVRR